ncbi:NAD(P)H-quinone oxidoreductase [Salinimonas sp. HHU 13199]|uniref:NAD(P)H-quinone oxidoreductase n=1 Tax=Salinimonas profundi TaxID=2729140 RepID=A0ABR8LEV8_9ALTE|nr:NAD(P)H-quinone oxidoreductase [Salinimonas profundi]MBD3584806.1 NAD(P)H-quinone oxidoreductase [Salinimonas profundi]
MRYIDYDSEAGPEGLAIRTTDSPSVTKGKVKIKVHAFGVNRADTLQRQGKYPPPPGESEILGLEAAGEVLEVASDVTQWKPGDSVFGLMPGGGYAEEAVVDARHLMPLPSHLSMHEAAGLSEVFLTAYQALFDIAQTPAQGRALIHAGASGVGLAAIQLCKLERISTAVTASTDEKLALCESLGASCLINYKQQDFAKIISEQWNEGVNTVIDFVGGDYLNRNLSVLAKDGTVVYLAMLGGRYADKLDLGLMLAKRAKVIGSTLRSRSDEYKAHLINAFTARFLGAFSQGGLKVNLDTVYAAEDIATAHQRLEKNDTQGKLIAHW